MLHVDGRSLYPFLVLLNSPNLVEFVPIVVVGNDDVVLVVSQVHWVVQIES